MCWPREHILKLGNGSLPSQQFTWSRDETPCPRSLLGLDRNRPSCCTSHMLLRDTRLALEATKPLHKVVLGSYHSVTSGAWVEEGNYCPQVLPFMWRAHLPLACRLQGWHKVVCAICTLSQNVCGTGTICDANYIAKC